MNVTIDIGQPYSVEVLEKYAGLDQVAHLMSAPTGEEFSTMLDALLNQADDGLGCFRGIRNCLYFYAALAAVVCLVWLVWRVL